MRKHFIDNLRWLCVLLLFLYHTSMIYNGFGENFYIRGDAVPVLNDLILICSPWFMPLMFTLAGISTCYALERRSPGAYSKERFFKLFIPLIAGLLLIIPMQTYFAERFHNGYTGGYFAQYILFFTRPTDLSGYTGGFTPGHLWFILYLFIISMVALPLIVWYKKSRHKLPVDKITVPMLLPMFVITSIMSLVLNLGGKSMGYFFSFFMLGYFVLSRESIQVRLVKSRWALLGGLIVLSVLRVVFQNISIGDMLYGLYNDLTGWLGILTFLGLGRQYLNTSSRVTQYFAEASFPIYILHQSILVTVAFYMFKLTDSVPLQVVGIIIGSFVVTIAAYEVLKRTPVTRFLLGIKQKKAELKTEKKQ